MFYQYEIINNGKEDILYLYLNMKYEFSNELSFNDEEDLGRRTKNFIKTNNINFKGNKVYLIVDGIVTKVLDISNITDTIKISDYYSVDNFMINIKFDVNSFCEITLREYLTSILLSNYNDNIHNEVLKAICVLYNGYAYKMMRDNNYILSDNSFATYKPMNYYRQIINDYDEVINRINNIIDETNCIFLSYNDDYILPFIHFSNAGKTLTNSNYPYLSSVKSLWDMTSPYYIEANDFTYDELKNIFNINVTNNSKINMMIKDKIKKLVIDNNIYTLEEIKNILNLKSTDIYLIINNDNLRVITKGYGNSYGLSIYGASEIALNGSKYYNILNYYFPKAKLLQYINNN